MARFDFSQAVFGGPGYDTDDGLFLSENFVGVVAVDMIRATEFVMLVDVGWLAPVDDHLEPANGWTRDQVCSFLRGSRGAYSRFRSDDRVVRDVLAGMIDELAGTGRLRISLLPPGLFGT